MQRLHLLIIAPNKLLREGLRLILGEAVYSIEDAPSIEHHLDAHGRQPDLVLWGPGGSMDMLRVDIPAARAAWSAGRPVRLIALADVSAAATSRRLCALDLDAVLSDDISSEILQRSIELVTLGERLFPHARAVRPRDPAPARRADILAFPVRGGARPVRPATQPSYDVVLSSRESQILQQLMDGATNKLIARTLQIAEATVKVHVKGLLRKIRATNRTQAAIWALHNPHSVADRAAPEKLARSTGR